MRGLLNGIGQFVEDSVIQTPGDERYLQNETKMCLNGIYYHATIRSFCLGQHGGRFEGKGWIKRTKRYAGKSSRATIEI